MKRKIVHWRAPVLIQQRDPGTPDERQAELVEHEREVGRRQKQRFASCRARLERLRPPHAQHSAADERRHHLSMLGPLSATTGHVHMKWRGPGRASHAPRWCMRKAHGIRRGQGTLVRPHARPLMGSCNLVVHQLDEQLADVLQVTASPARNGQTRHPC